MHVVVPAAGISMSSHGWATAFPFRIEDICRILNLQGCDAAAAMTVQPYPGVNSWSLSVRIPGQPSIFLVAKTLPPTGPNGKADEHARHNCEVSFYSSPHGQQLQEKRIVPTCYHADLDLVLIEDPSADGWRPIQASCLDELITGMPVQTLSRAAALLAKFHLEGLSYGDNSLFTREFFVKEALATYDSTWRKLGNPPVEQAASWHAFGDLANSGADSAGGAAWLVRFFCMRVRRFS